MNVNITITHTIAPEVIDILKNFSRGLDPLQPVPVTETVKTKSTKKELVAVTNTPTTADVTPVDEINITTEQVRAKTAEVIQSGKRNEVAQLLTEYGVGKLTELPKEQYASFYKKVTEL